MDSGPDATDDPIGSSDTQTHRRDLTITPSPATHGGSATYVIDERFFFSARADHFGDAPGPEAPPQVRNLEHGVFCLGGDPSLHFHDPEIQGDRRDTSCQAKLG